MHKHSETTKKMLDFVKTHPGCTSSEISAYCAIPLNTVTSRIVSLFAKGFLRRETDFSAKRLTYRYFLIKELPEPPQEPPTPQLRIDISALADSIVNAIMAEVERRLNAALETAVQRAIKQLPPQIASKQKIAIIGLLPQQAGIIQQEFGNEFDIRFVDSNETSRLKSVASHSDSTIIMADFIDHATEERVRAVGVKPLIIHGGMSRLRDTLTELYVEAQK